MGIGMAGTANSYDHESAAERDARQADYLREVSTKLASHQIINSSPELLALRETRNSKLQEFMKAHPEGDGYEELEAQLDAEWDATFARVAASLLEP